MSIRRYKNEKYIAWIRMQPCCFPGCRRQGPSDPHHIKGIGHMSGVGLTAPDWAAMPLCRECHDRLQTQPELWPLQWRLIGETLGKAIAAEIFVPTDDAAEDIVRFLGGLISEESLTFRGGGACVVRV